MFLLRQEGFLGREGRNIFEPRCVIQKPFSKKIVGHPKKKRYFIMGYPSWYICRAPDLAKNLGHAENVHVSPCDTLIKPSFHNYGIGL